MHRVAVWASIALVSLGLLGCGAGGTGAGSGVQVVATTSVLGDIARNVVGDAGSVEVVIESGVDPHAFEPSAADVDLLRRADLVIANGLQLEAGLSDALRSAEDGDVPILHVVDHLDPIPFSGEQAHGDESEGDQEDDEHGELDPHFWFDPVRTAEAVTLIGERVADAAPEAADAVRANAEAYRDEVLRLHAEVEDILAAVPETDRKLVTNHDSLGYLAARYGFEVIGTVVPGGTTLAEASGRELAELAETIRGAGVRAIFVETTAPTRLAEAVRAELAGGIEVVELHTGALGESGSGADTYLGMMETNARRIADGLTS